MRQSGPTPCDLLAAVLGAYTAMTLRMYARHKQIPLDQVSVAVPIVAARARRPRTC